MTLEECLGGMKAIMHFQQAKTLAKKPLATSEQFDRYRIIRVVGWETEFGQAANSLEMGQVLSLTTVIVRELCYISGGIIAEEGMVLAKPVFEALAGPRRRRQGNSPEY